MQWQSDKEKTEKSEQPLEQTVQYCATSEGKSNCERRPELGCCALLTLLCRFKNVKLCFNVL